MKKNLSILLIVISVMLLFTCTTAFAVTVNSVTHVEGQDSTTSDNQDTEKPKERIRTPYKHIEKEVPPPPVQVPEEPKVTAPAPTPAPVVVPAPAPVEAPKELPKTGGDILMFIFPGIALVGAGWAIRRRMAV